MVDFAKILKGQRKVSLLRDEEPLTPMRKIENTEELDSMVEHQDDSDIVNREFTDAPGVDDVLDTDEAGASKRLQTRIDNLSRALADAKARAPQPSIGRIVIYNHPGSLDGKHAPQQSPALVQHVNDDGTCRLWVFGPKGLFIDDNLKRGTGPCEWDWPPRV